MAIRDSGRTVRQLQSFEVVSRHLSLTKAASELGVTTSAISHQLRELRATLGENLIEESGRGIVLTPLGLKLSRELGAAFSSIEQSVSKAIGGNNSQVRIAVCSSFGPGWLAPRFCELARFRPGVDFQIFLYTQSPKLSDEVADAFVTTRPGAEGYWSMPLFQEHLWAVGGIEASKQGFPAGFDKFITTDTKPENIGADWLDFAKATNLELDFSKNDVWVKCSHFIVAIELARNGVGVALVPEFLASNSLRVGMLERVHAASIPSGRQYHLCIKRSRRHEDNLQSLANWFSLSVRQYLREPSLNPSR